MAPKRRKERDVHSFARGAAGGQAPEVFGLLEGGKAQELEGYLKENPGAVGDQDASGGTPLHKCCQLRDYGCMEVLVRHRPDPNAADSTGSTPLHIAVMNSADDLIPPLIGLGADPCVVDSEGQNALHWGARMGDKSIVEILTGDLSDGEVLVSDLDLPGLLATQDNTGCTPLHYSTSEDATDVTLYLLQLIEREVESVSDRAKIVNTPNAMKHTALHFAATAGEEAALTKMLGPEFGADLMAPARNGATVLHLAVVAGQLPGVEAVLTAAKSRLSSGELKAFLDLPREDSGHTAFQYAKADAIKTALLDCGATEKEGVSRPSADAQPATKKTTEKGPVGAGAANGDYSGKGSKIGVVPPVASGADRDLGESAFTPECLALAAFVAAIIMFLAWINSKIRG